MEIKDYVKKYDIPFDKLKSENESDFKSLYEDQIEWLINLEDKIYLLENKKKEAAFLKVVKKLKSKEPFREEDAPELSLFVSNINSIVKIANRINNFKEGTDLENGSALNLYDFFNTVKEFRANLKDCDYI